MRCIAVALVVLCAPTLALGGPKLTLDQTIAKALGGPKARMAGQDVAAAQARVDEAGAARLPRIKATLYGTASPKITCIDAACTETSSRDFTLNFDGAFGSAQIDITQPLFTFGKLSHAMSAARRGVEAQRALGDEAAGDLALDAARAYWGVKLARELGYMLDDGIEEIDKAIKQMNERTGADAPTLQDRNRVAILLAEAKVQRADAAAGERQALAGLRALTGVPDADVDDDLLAAVPQTLPRTVSPDGRGQTRAAKAGAAANDELAAFARASYFPDLAIVASGVIARAHGVQDPPSAFANDPFNRTSAGIVLALQGNIEPWSVRAKVSRARAEAGKAHALADLAAAGARYDAELALAEARGAQEKLTATVDGEKAGRAWVVSVLQANAIGVAESKDLADAYIAWFGMKAKWAQAVFQWNVAVVRLSRATGGFRAANPVAGAPSAP